jgi:hypothetical protein
MFASITPWRRICLEIIFLLGPVFLLADISKGADSYSVGQAVQVREGDTWSKARVTAREGRRYQIHYDGSEVSSDEWVGTDRIRASSDNPAIEAPAAAANPAAANDAAASPFNIGDQIEAKWGGLWRKATVINKTNDWTMVQYDNVWYEWVQPWRLRKIGSDEDTEKDSSPRDFVQLSTPAPTQSPEELSAGNSRRHFGRGGAETDSSDADDFHISSTVGPDGIAITKVIRTGHEIAPSTVTGTPAPDNATSFNPELIALGQANTALGEKIDLLSTPRGNVALLTTMPANWREPGSIQRIDLRAARAGASITLAPLVIPLAISPDGNRMITRSDKFFPATKWRLDLWTLDSDHPKPLLSFRPFASNANQTDQVLWARYLDSSHLLACSSGHTLNLWDISDTAVEQVYSLQCDSTIEPRLSAGGGYVTLGYGGQVLICQAITGKCVAQTISLAGVDGSVADINRDLSRIAICGASRLTICDLRNGESVLDTGLPVGVTGDDVAWIGPNLLMIDNRWIFNVAHRAMVWEYTAHDHPPCTKWIGNMLALVGNEDGNRTLSLADPLAAQVMQADAQLTDGTFEIQRGTKVSLVLNISCSDTEKEKITEALTRRIQQAGLILADNQPIQLAVDVKDYNPRKVTYRGMGFSRGNETVTVFSTAEVLSFVKDSKPIWSVYSADSGFAPIVVLRRNNESVADALQHQKEARLDWFTKIGIPQTVLKPADPAGSSPLTAMIRSTPHDAN